MKHDQSVSNKTANKEVDKTAKQLLDHGAQVLSDRHASRLEQMTHNAETHYVRVKRLKTKRLNVTSLININTYIKRIYLPQHAIPLAMACSALLGLWLWWPGGQPAQVQTDPIVVKASPKTQTSGAELPRWVMDTSVPIALLKNRAFYDWLVEQEDVNRNG